MRRCVIQCNCWFVISFSNVASFLKGNILLQNSVNEGLCANDQSNSTANLLCGLGSSVGIATDYGLDGPGSNPGGDEIFRPSGPALGPTQPPVK